MTAGGNTFVVPSPSRKPTTCSKRGRWLKPWDRSVFISLRVTARQLRPLRVQRPGAWRGDWRCAALLSTAATTQSKAQIAAALIRGWRPTRPQSRGGQHPVFEPLFRVDAQPIPESINLQDLPAPLRMFTYVREQQTQPSMADPEAWAVQDIQSSDSSSAHDSGECPEEAPPPRSSLALCLVQVTTGAAVHAVYSSPEHLQAGTPTKCYFLADCQYLSPILLSGPCMADAEEQLTSDKAMRNLLSSARVPDMLVEYILGLGFEDIRVRRCIRSQQAVGRRAARNMDLHESHRS